MGNFIQSSLYSGIFDLHCFRWQSVWDYFTNFNFTTGGQFIGISNYKNLFSGSDPYFYKSLLVTVIYVALSVPTAIIFSFFIAMLLNTNVKGKGFFRTIFYLPTVVPIVAMAAVGYGFSIRTWDWQTIF